jgi:hypothetical protein
MATRGARMRRRSMSRMTRRSAEWTPAVVLMVVVIVEMLFGYIEGCGWIDGSYPPVLEMRREASAPRRYAWISFFVVVVEYIIMRHDKAKIKQASPKNARTRTRYAA